MKPPLKYIGMSLNQDYVDYLENKISSINSVVKFAERWSNEQGNGLTDGEICISAMKDIRRHLKE